MGTGEVDMDPHQGASSKPSVAHAQVDIEALYLEHKDAMWGKALRMLDGDHNRAADAVQGAIVKVISRKAATNPDNWEAVLVKAVEWTILDWWKSAAHRREQLQIDGDAPLQGGWLGDDDLAADPADDVDRREDRLATNATVREALAELQTMLPDAHYAFLQVKGVGRTSKDVAEELGVSDSRVRQHVMRARTELVRILEARGGER